jgi:hypothetical protein
MKTTSGDRYNGQSIPDQSIPIAAQVDGAQIYD